MSYQGWMQQVRHIVGQAGCSLADLGDWDWQSAHDDALTPEEAAGDALRERWYMSESDPDFYDYMAYSDADPGL